MKNNERLRKNLKSDKDQRPHKAQHGSEPIVNKSLTREGDQSPILETPFYSRMDEHAATLSRIPFTAQRQEYIMRLNNAYGLRYVQRLLESVNAQAKLTVSDPGDIYEQEADKVADEVTQKINIQAQRQEVPEEEELIQGKPDIQRQEELEEEELLQAKLDIQKQEEEEEEEEEIQAQRQEEEEEELVQMKRDENAEADVADEIETRINSAKGSGQSLSGEVKKPMEQAFGAGFNDVKIHTDTEADTLNKQLNAKAFTTGTDIFFRNGEFNPDSDSGKKLLAHELTHVVQQSTEVKKKTLAETGEEIERRNPSKISRLTRVPEPKSVVNANLQGTKNIIQRDTAIKYQNKAGDDIETYKLTRDKNGTAKVKGRMSYTTAISIRRIITLAEKGDELQKKQLVKNHKLEYSAEALQILDELITRYENKPPTAEDVQPKIGRTTKCDEGQVKKARRDKDLDFGDVTTCLTITAFCQDSSRIGAHEGQTTRVGSDWSKFFSYCEDAGGINKIELVGVLDNWYIKLNENFDAALAGPDNLQPFKNFRDLDDAHEKNFFGDSMGNHLKMWAEETFKGATIANPTQRTPIMWPRVEG
ncbi:MAG: DUF4157 domain-containing protein [Dehalococcoidales bacterium]|nr:DUF4157 domain-containing protein [Dehalococcoidales bacterium]